MKMDFLLFAVTPEVEKQPYLMLSVLHFMENQPVENAPSKSLEIPVHLMKFQQL